MKGVPGLGLAGFMVKKFEGLQVGKKPAGS